MTDMKSLEPPDYPNADWLFFRDNPDRCYCARLATSAEIDQLQQEQGLDVAALAPGCFVYAVSRLTRQADLRLERLFVLLEPQGDMLTEADCMAAWQSAEAMAGR